MANSSSSDKAWRQGTDDKLLSVYEAIPYAVRTRFRVSEGLRTFESFVECYDHLRTRERQSPRVLVAAHTEWELWMCLPLEERPAEELLCLELVSWRIGEFGRVVERVALMGYRDLVGETDYPTDTVWWLTNLDS
ncbi:hypothetical protein DRW03_34705 [Corallococcus sp. H22C18031201]|nr:hypothetical protein DRW03_34705 [Corallococcus sp. H22C18031201]